MSVTPVSTPHVAPQSTPAPAANKNATGTASNVAGHSKPTKSAPAPGTGLKVDKHA